MRIFQFSFWKVFIQGGNIHSLKEKVPRYLLLQRSKYNFHRGGYGEFCWTGCPKYRDITSGVAFVVHKDHYTSNTIYPAILLMSFENNTMGPCNNYITRVEGRGWGQKPNKVWHGGRGVKPLTSYSIYSMPLERHKSRITVQETRWWRRGIYRHQIKAVKRP